MITRIQCPTHPNTNEESSHPPKCPATRARPCRERAPARNFPKPVKHYHLVNVFQCVLLEVADLGQLASERRKLPAENPRPLRFSFFGKRERKIAHAHLPYSHMQKIDDAREANARWPAPAVGAKDPRILMNGQAAAYSSRCPHSGSGTLNRQTACQHWISLRRNFGEGPARRGVPSSLCKAHFGALNSRPTSPPPAPTWPA